MIYKKLLIQKNETIYEAIKIIDSTDLRACFVTNKDNKLCGSVTDGDIRRGLLKKISFEEKIFKICNKKPKYVYEKNKNVKKFSTDINCIPIINKNKKILGIKVLKKKTNRNIKTALIMAGGKGKRLLPLTKRVPKPLIKVNGKSLLESLIQKMDSEGIKNIKITLHHMADKVKNHLEKKKFDINSLEYLYEKKPLGTAGSIKLLKTNDDNFLMVNCDVKLNVNFAKICDFHLSHNADITIISKRIINKSNFGILNLDTKFIVKSIEEKPVSTSYINTGAYILKKKISHLIKKDKKIDMDELIKIAIKKKLKVISYPLYENWSDLGTISSLTKFKKNELF